MDYIIKRNIISGYHRGNLLKFPTLNVRYHSYDYKKIGFGIWASLTKFKDNYCPSVTFAGNAVTFKNNSRIIETHLLDIKTLPSIKKIQIVFIKKIRKIKNFKNINALKLQIAKDCIISKEILSKYV